MSLVNPIQSRPIGSQSRSFAVGSSKLPNQPAAPPPGGEPPRASVFTFVKASWEQSKKHYFHREKSPLLFFPFFLLLMPKWYQSSNSVSTAVNYWLSASVTLRVIFQLTLSLCCHSGRNADWLHTTELKCFRLGIFKIHLCYFQVWKTSCTAAQFPHTFSTCL